MPVAVPLIAAVAGSMAASAAIAAGYGALAAAVIGGLVSTGINMAFAPKPKRASVRGAAYDVNLAGSDLPLYVIYGERMVSPTLVFAHASEWRNNHWFLAWVVGEGPIESMGTILLNDQPETDAKLDAASTITKHLGAADQVADADWVARIPDVWTTAHRGRGVAWVAMHLYHDPDTEDDVWLQGLPRVQVPVEGRVLYDPRTETSAYSSNPALVILDYLTNSTYGKGLALATDIDTDSFITAADYCDELVGGVKRFTCNGIVDPTRRLFDNIDQLLTSCQGALMWRAGQWSLYIDRLTAPSGFVLSEANIIGDWSISLGGKDRLFNRVQVHYFNAAKNYATDTLIVDSTAYRVEDGAQVLELETELPYTTTAVEANRIARWLLKSSRQSIRVSLTATLAALECAIGDVVAVTHDSTGWDGKLFRVAGLELTGEDTVKVSLAEYDDSVYDLDDLTPEAEAPDTTWPSPYHVEAPTNLHVYSGDSYLLLSEDGSIIYRLYLTWDQPADPFTQNGQIEMQYKRSIDSTWIPAGRAHGNDTSYYIAPVHAGVTYDVRIRAINTAGNVSAWTTVAGHSSSVRTSAPEPPTGFTATSAEGAIHLRWTLPSDPDLGWIEIWRAGTNNRSSAVLIARTLADVHYDPVGAGLVRYYWIRAVNTSMVMSAWQPSSETGGLEGTSLDFPLPGPFIDVETPTAAAGLVATSAFSSVILTWTAASYTGHAHTEIWRANSNNRAVATLIGTSAATIWTDYTRSVGQTGYYWIRHVNTLGTAGTWNAGINAGTSAATRRIMGEELSDLIIEAQHLADASVTQDKIGTAAVGTDQLADGSIIVDKLLTGVAANWAVNAACEYSARDWYCYDPGSPTQGMGTGELDEEYTYGGLLTKLGSTWQIAPGGAYIHQPNGTSTAASAWLYPPILGGVDSTPGSMQLIYRGGGWVPVLANTRYEWSCYLANHRSQTARVVLQWYDEDKAYLSANYGANITVSGGQYLANWGRSSVLAVSPSSARFVIATIEKGATVAGQANSYLMATRPYFSQATPNQTEPSIWTPGAQSRVVAEQIYALAITSDRLAANSIIAGKIAANAIVAGDGVIANAAIGTAQIGALAVTQAKIANAAVDTAQIADAAITTAKIENAAITSAKIGTAEIRTANIATANITTLNVANNAISGTAASAHGQVLIPEGETWVTISEVQTPIYSVACRIVATYVGTVFFPGTSNRALEGRINVHYWTGATWALMGWQTTGVLTRAPQTSSMLSAEPLTTWAMDWRSSVSLSHMFSGTAQTMYLVRMQMRSAVTPAADAYAQNGVLSVVGLMR